MASDPESLDLALDDRVVAALESWTHREALAPAEFSVPRDLLDVLERAEADVQGRHSSVDGVLSAVAMALHELQCASQACTDLVADLAAILPAPLGTVAMDSATVSARMADGEALLKLLAVATTHLTETSNRLRTELASAPPSASAVLRAADAHMALWTAWDENDRGMVAAQSPAGYRSPAPALHRALTSGSHPLRPKDPLGRSPKAPAAGDALPPAKRPLQALPSPDRAPNAPSSRAAAGDPRSGPSPKRARASVGGPGAAIGSRPSIGSPSSAQAIRDQLARDAERDLRQFRRWTSEDHL